MNKFKVLVATMVLLLVFVFIANAEQYTNEEQFFNQKLTEGKYVDFKEQPAAPGSPVANTARIYAIDNGAGVTKIYVKDSAGTATDLGASASVGTLDQSYDSGGAGVGRTITASDGAVTITSTDADAAYLLSVTPTPGAGAALGGISIASGANATQDSLHIVNSGTGDDIEAGNSAFKVSKTGVVTGLGATIGASGATIAGDLQVVGATTMSGNLYQANIAAAAAGNANLTINAAGNGVITVGNVSTGPITFTGLNDVDFYGNVNIGTAASDTLTITSVVDGNLTLYDAVTDSPSLILKDATAQTAILTKVDAGKTTFTTAAAGGLNILTGNLWIGNGTPGVNVPNGEDLYVEGTSEFDGAFQVDGAAAFAGTVELSGSPTITAATTTFTMPAAGTIVIDAATTDNTGSSGVINIDTDTITSNASSINIKQTGIASGGAVATYGISIDLDDDTDAAATLNGISIGSSDTVGSSEVRGIILANTLETGMKISAGAAERPFWVDAASAVSTITTGAVDVDYQTITNGASGINIDFGVGDAGAGVTAAALWIDTDDDTASNAATIDAIHIVASDVTGHATTVNRGIYISGSDVALQADNGYVRIGTGSTPDITPGDDDLFVEGTAEVDGEVRLDGKLDINGMANLGASGALTIATGAITATKSFHNIDTEGAAASDDLDTINGGVDGAILVIRAVNTGHSVVVKNASGNINCPADITLDNSNDTVMMIYSGTLSKWLCLSSSNNGA